MIRLQNTRCSPAPVDTLATRMVWHAGILKILPLGNRYLVWLLNRHNIQLRPDDLLSFNTG